MILPNDEPVTVIRFQVHQVEKDDTVRDYYFSPENYSEFYNNNQRYELQDAIAHAKQITARHPYIKLAIVKITQTEEVIWRNK